MTNSSGRAWRKKGRTGGAGTLLAKTIVGGDRLTIYVINNNSSKMSKVTTAGVLAAGEGSRIQKVTAFKPMLPILGQPMVDRLVCNLHGLGMHSILTAFNTSAKDIDFSQLIGFQKPGVDRFFIDTPSSLHTFWAVFQRLYEKNVSSEGSPVSTHFLISMVDTILRQSDLEGFLDHCRQLSEGESCILATRFIDDEKPLVVKTNAKGCATSFGEPFEPGSLVTSGLYCFSIQIYPLLQQSVENGMQRMRNFLAELVQNQHRIHVYSVEQTIDIDRPEDISVAENFLQKV